MQMRKLVRAAVVVFSASSSGAFAQGAPQPDLSGNDAHWIKLTVWGQDCWTFDPNPVRGEYVTWSGGCSNELTSGAGTETWYHPNGVLSGTSTGTMVNGYFEGQVTQEHTINGARHHDVGKFVHGIQNGHSTLETYDSNGRITERDEVYLINNIASGPGSKTLYRPDGSVSWQYTGPFANGRPAPGQSAAPSVPKNTPTISQKAASQQPVQGVFDNTSKASFTFMGIRLGVPITASVPECPAAPEKGQVCYENIRGTLNLSNFPEIGLAYLLGILTLYDDNKNPIYEIDINFLEADLSDVVAMFTAKYLKPTSTKTAYIDVNGERQGYTSPTWDLGEIKIVIFMQAINNGINPLVKIIDKKLNAIQEAYDARQKENQIQSGASKF
ncbi:MAG: hypothetical protein EPN57_01885 [Paraburkholderia sp.]|nr:MAG: hypothetical protein EPN57_01885 [Paraburkholderia sp.]